MPVFSNLCFSLLIILLELYHHLIQYTNAPDYNTFTFSLLSIIFFSSIRAQVVWASSFPSTALAVVDLLSLLSYNFCARVVSVCHPRLTYHCRWILFPSLCLRPCHTSVCIRHCTLKEPSNSPREWIEIHCNFPCSWHRFKMLTHSAFVFQPDRTEKYLMSFCKAYSQITSARCVS